MSILQFLLKINFKYVKQMPRVVFKILECVISFPDMKTSDFN